MEGIKYPGFNGRCGYQWFKGGCIVPFNWNIEGHTTESLLEECRAVEELYPRQLGCTPHTLVRERLEQVMKWKSE